VGDWDMLQHGLHEPGIKQVDASMSQRWRIQPDRTAVDKAPERALPAKIISFRCPSTRPRRPGVVVRGYRHLPVLASARGDRVAEHAGTDDPESPGTGDVMGVTGEILGGASRDLGLSPAELIG
jgi:hypothetical protein